MCMWLLRGPPRGPKKRSFPSMHVEKSLDFHPAGLRRWFLGRKYAPPPPPGPPSIFPSGFCHLDRSPRDFTPLPRAAKLRLTSCRHYLDMVGISRPPHQH